MEKYFTLIQLALAGAIAWLSNKLGILFPMLIVLSILMVADYITGMAASKKESVDHPDDASYGWSSAKGAKGILKKVGYMAVIYVAVTLDYLTMIMATHLGFNLPRNTFFFAFDNDMVHTQRATVHRRKRGEAGCRCTEVAYEVYRGAKKED